MDINKEFNEKLRSVLFESICIKGRDGKCDRTQENKLFVDFDNINKFINKAIK